MIFGRTSALLLAMMTPYLFVYEQGRENTQRPESWQKRGGLTRKKEIPRVQSCVDNPPGGFSKRLPSTLMIIKILPSEISKQFEWIAERNQLSVDNLYIRNTELSKITWETLKIFELNLRSHINQVMRNFTQTTNWQQVSGLLIPKDQSRIPMPPKHYRVLGLGFYCLLFSDRYHTKLWIPCLKPSLPSWMRTRRELHANFSSLVQVRNRIAHHEIIYNFPLIEILDFAQEILADINEFAAEEIRSRNLAETINRIRLGSGGGI